MTILGKYINLSTDPVVWTQKSGRKKNNIIRTEKRTRPVFMDKGKFNTGSRALSPFDYTILIITFRKQQQQQQQKQSNLFRQFVCTDSSAEQSVLLQINNLSKSFGNICTHSTPLTTQPNSTVDPIWRLDFVRLQPQSYTHPHPHPPEHDTCPVLQLYSRLAACE